MLCLPQGLPLLSRAQGWGPRSFGRGRPLEICLLKGAARPCGVGSLFSPFSLQRPAGSSLGLLPGPPPSHSRGGKSAADLAAKLLLLDELVSLENDATDTKKKRRSFPGFGSPLDRLSAGSVDLKANQRWATGHVHKLPRIQGPTLGDWGCHCWGGGRMWHSWGVRAARKRRSLTHTCTACIRSP